MDTHKLCTLTLTTEERYQAIYWLDDCGYDLSIDNTDVTDAQLHRAIQREYVGGWSQFARDSQLVA